MEECYCGDYSVYSKPIIEEIALEKSCDAYFDPDYCQAGVHILALDVWLAIQAGSCECTAFANDARTLRLYWNDHPLAIESVTQSKTSAYSPLLSIAALSAVVLGFFVFGATKCVHVLNNRTQRTRRVRRVVQRVEQETEPPVLEMT
jgi:hypothetical protein